MSLEERIEETSTETPALNVTLEHIKFYNLAIWQNGFPLVRELVLENHLGRTLEHVECRFWCEPEFFAPETVVVDSLADGEVRHLDKVDLKLKLEALSELSEMMRGTLHLQLTADCEEGREVLKDEQYEVEAFAPDQWLGIGFIPELLASFVTPNLEIISQLQALVAEELKELTGDSSIAGYLEDKKRVHEICMAIYRAIHQWGIHYALPSVSFGMPGQRIRFADTIYRMRLGTCLDTTLLFASVMEACHLHPVLMLQKGHAYIGCHLVEQYFADVPMDDLQAIRKRVDLDEFLVLETTLVTGNATFEEAEARARTEHLNVGDDFQYAIDVVRARYGGIHPLPLKRSVGGMELELSQPVEELASETGRTLQEEIDTSKLSVHQSAGRMERWSQKLLDMSLRNRLLNVRDGKHIIPIICPDISSLEDRLAAAESIRLNALSDLLSEKDLHDILAVRNCKYPVDKKELLVRELEQKRLWTNLTPFEMLKRMTSLYRECKSDLEESGVNTLFLGVGFVEWKEAESDDRSFLAPILLMPIRWVRKSLAEGIQIVRLDEETVINETLLEMLRTRFRLQIPGIEPLPMDDSGVDVKRVMQLFRQTIRDMKGWEVWEEAKIGHFSFGKYLMWHDLTVRQEALLQNPLVKHLASGGGMYEDGIETFDPKDVESHIRAAELYCPMSADSSQLAAVLFSEKGKSFVLHGPPGTGKSQTITNIIAHNLALGRRVLFVSEKKAALDVVHHRLSAVGLRPFCLELHSNKAGKAGVLAQFTEALQVAETSLPSDWEATVQKLEANRAELNAYVEALHHVYPNGFSAYDCFSSLLRQKTPSLRRLLRVDFLTQPRETYEAQAELLTHLAQAWQSTTREAVVALRPLSVPTWTPAIEEEVRTAADELCQRIVSLRAAFEAQASALGLPLTEDLNTLQKCIHLVQEVLACPAIPSVLLSEDIGESSVFLRHFAAQYQQLHALQEKLAEYDSDGFSRLNFVGLKHRISEVENAFVLARIFKKSALLKEMAWLKKAGGTPLTLPELSALLPTAEEYLQVRKEVETQQTRAAELLGTLWKNGSPDWEAMDAVLTSAGNVLSCVDAIAAGDLLVRGSIVASLQKLLPEAATTLAQGSKPRAVAESFLEAWADFNAVRSRMEAQAEALREIRGLAELETCLRDMVPHWSEMRRVLGYEKLRVQALAQSLDRVVEALESGDLSAQALQTGYREFYCREMLDSVLSVTPVLSDFLGTRQEERVKQFCELDAKVIALTRQLVFAKLAERLPRRRMGTCPVGSELGILKHECGKQARQMPVRQLLEKIPSLAPTLKPCFLMSPLSVAQYLPPDSAPFDLIVFDEASQIPVWDAIGVIARGKQLIVVGDPKQMPPTNFFQKGEGEEVDEAPDVQQDLESILDECIAAGVPSTHLNWHYRSRHESLIAFSNHHYYEDELFTFPAARNTPTLGIQFQFVPDGVYDRRGTRTNEKEARALVRYVIDRLEHAPAKKRSIGIVTFSQAQKDRIEDLLEEARRKHPKLEPCFSDQNEEPLFVKNLENVQGDERDVILFSIGYAPDAEGKFSMNFGPLNWQGGERRLNVAITRAKEQVVVFSSIHAEQIDLSRTRATGSEHLKKFLEYAERGTVLSIPHRGSGASSEGLIETIAAFLAAKGYRYERKVGCSGMQIDLAVRNPDAPDEYLLGIECDGPAYAAQRTTRDRDGLRASVLRSLGWNMIRAWSVDWAFDREKAETELQTLLETLREAARHPAPEPTSPAEPEPEPAPAATTTPAPAPAQEVPRSLHRKDYTPWIPSSTFSTETFYAPETQTLIAQQMRDIVACEGPIYESVLKKRLLHAWGFSRAGNTIQNILADCLPKTLEQTSVGSESVYWPEDCPSSEYSDYRVSPPAEDRRDMDEIPPEELANAMVDVLEDVGSCDADSLYRENRQTLRFLHRYRQSPPHPRPWLASPAQERPNLTTIENEGYSYLPTPFSFPTNP